MAEAPASSRRRTLLTSRHIGEAEATSGFSSLRPRYVVDALYPDNTAESLGFAGGVNLPATPRLMAYISPEWMRQNSAFLPYTVNRSEEHTSELQSLRHLVCRLLL